MTFYNKLKWILGIVLVFVLIVTTNLIDRNNFLRVKSSVETLYEDRLIANDLLFDLSVSIQEKERSVLKKDSLFFFRRNAALRTEIQGYILQYQDTKLIEEERRLFDQLKMELSQLELEEKQFIDSGFQNNEALINRCASIQANLQGLSKIQLFEGRRQVSISNKAIDTVELYTHIEIYLLAFLALIVQVLILYQPKKDAS